MKWVLRSLWLGITLSWTSILYRGDRGGVEEIPLKRAASRNLKIKCILNHCVTIDIDIIALLFNYFCSEWCGTKQYRET